MKYDYQCENCGAERVEDHRITEDPTVMCDECGAECTRRISGGTGFILKGGRWFKEGYS